MIYARQVVKGDSAYGFHQRILREAHAWNARVSEPTIKPGRVILTPGLSPVFDSSVIVARYLRVF